MNLAETMMWLASNYKLGIGVATGVVVLLYVGSSLAVLFKSRKMGVDVAVGAMIPVWRVKYPIQGYLMNRPAKESKKANAPETKGT